MKILSFLVSLLFFWRKKKSVVPVVRLSGVISATPSLRRGLSLESIEPQLKKAFSVRSARAIALIINSPGGSPVQSALIGQRIRDLAGKADVPVLAFCEDVAASGGYWIAASADEIYANGASIIGSIGVVSAGFGFDRAIEKIGVDRRVQTAGRNKMILDPFQPQREEDVERLQELQMDIHQQFITHLLDRRGSRLREPHDDLFSGAFWTGQRAVELGLVDGLGECRQVLRERFGEEINFMFIEPRRKFLAGLSGLPGSLAGGIVEEAAEIATERTMLSRFGL